MTDENFYRTQGSPWKTVIPSIMQYSGLLLGVGNMVSAVVSEKVSGKVDHLSIGLGLGLGLWGYLLGKRMEYAHRSDALANSFTHLEETLREEFKRNNQSVR